MRARRDIAKPLAYWIVAAGCILAALTAFAPLPIGVWKLSGTFLALGMIPYIVYGSLTETLGCCALIGAGCSLLAVDIAARAGADIVHVSHTDPLPAVWLSLVLTLLVIPAGAAAGKVAGRFRQ